MASAGRHNRTRDDDRSDAPVYDYANQFEVGFSRDEVLLRMAQAYQGEDARARGAQVVMTPAYAKALLQLLTEAMAQYESAYGAVLAPGAGVASIPGAH